MAVDKAKKTFWLYDLFIFKESVFTTVKTRYLKGVPFVNRRYMKGVRTSSVKNSTVFKKVRGWTSGQSLFV